MENVYIPKEITSSLCGGNDAFLAVNEGYVCAICNKKRLIEEGILKG